MLSLPFTTVDVFTTTRYAGNPLAIVQLPSSRENAITTEQMQTIAREYNLSETVFIHPQTKAEDGLPAWRVRIFMTQAELPFAGHPTIGATCFALRTLAKGTTKGRLICNAGPIEVDLRDGVAKCGIPFNFHRHSEREVSADDVYAFQAGLGQIKAQLKAIDVVSPVKGMNFIAVELPDLSTLEAVTVTGVKPTATLDKGWEAGFCASYFYVLQSAEGSTVRSRMVEERMEDPATGSAACGLSILLAKKFKLGRRTKFEITQGVEMGRKSDIGVEVTLGETLEEVERVELSGSAVKVMEGTLEI